MQMRISLTTVNVKSNRVWEHKWLLKKRKAVKWMKTVWSTPFDWTRIDQRNSDQSQFSRLYCISSITYFYFVYDFIIQLKWRQIRWSRLRPWTWWVVNPQEECPVSLGSQLPSITWRSSLWSTNHHDWGLSLDHLMMYSWQKPISTASHLSAAPQCCLWRSQKGE